MKFAQAIVGGNQLIIDNIHSVGFVTGLTGWAIRKDGTAEFSDVAFAGSTLSSQNFSALDIAAKLQLEFDYRAFDTLAAPYTTTAVRALQFTIPISEVHADYARFGASRGVWWTIKLEADCRPTGAGASINLWELDIDGVTQAEKATIRVNTANDRLFIQKEWSFLRDCADPAIDAEIFTYHNAATAWTIQSPHTGWEVTAQIELLAP